MTINSLNKLKSLRGKRVWLRVDFNVPLAAGKVKDDFRIRAGLETIQYLVKRGAKVIVATHLGDPKGKRVVALSTRPIVARLQKLSGLRVIWLPEFSAVKLGAALDKLKDGEIIFLENLRFNPGELSNDSAFAKELVAAADIYVNDAFAVSHRAQASVAAVKKYKPAFAGLLLEKELRNLQKIIKPKKPLVVVMGGAKISTKAPIISRLMPNADKVLLGGGLANNFFKYQGLEIGSSLYDADSLVYVKKFFRKQRLEEKIVLPLDVAVKSGKKKMAKHPAQVGKRDSILDIGPEAIAQFSSYIKKAKTIIWNGPLGKFEDESFKQGTISIARAIASRASGPSFAVVGGGETVSALEATKMSEHIDWVSTAGGAMLAYLSGDNLPGLQGIIKK